MNLSFFAVLEHLLGEQPPRTGRKSRRAGTHDFDSASCGGYDPGHPTRMGITSTDYKKETKVIGLMKKSLMGALSVSAALIAGPAIADGKLPKILCHNIGGPFDLGANCEATGNCTFILPNGSTATFTGNQFLGILIGASGEQAIAAHLAHGDGYATAIYDPPLHMAPVIGPHQASNVECLATRVLPQPPEPGN